jgi:hypothetical protein
MGLCESNGLIRGTEVHETKKWAQKWIDLPLPRFSTEAS